MKGRHKMERMRRIATMAELQAALQAAFNAINRDFYNNELEKVIITVKEGKKKSAFGWIEVQKNWRQNGKDRHEINISADYLGERSVEDTIVTLMHEMVHLYNIQHGIKDTTRSGIYHNKEFAKTATAHGLICKQINQIGWSDTTADPTTQQWIKKNINIKSFGVFKQSPRGARSGGGKAKTSSRKYICPYCGLIARATKECKLICGECMEVMEIES